MQRGEADAACRELIDRFEMCSRLCANQKRLEPEIAGRGQADAERTRCHNLVISAKNKLSVYMYEHKLGNDWDDWLGKRENESETSHVMWYCFRDWKQDKK